MDKKDLFTLLSLAVLFTSCATNPKDPENGHGLNLAPPSMSPPSYDGANPTIDATYMQSQADYHYTLGEAYSLEGQSQKAIEELKLTLAYDNKSAQVRLRLASEYVRAGMTTEALEQGELAVEQDPKSVEAHLLLGGIYAAMKVYDKASDEYKAVIAIDPDNTEAPVYEGGILAEQKRFPEAIALFQGLAQRTTNPNRYQAYYYLGRMYLEMDEDHWPKAEVAFQKSIALKPSWPDSVIALAQLYHAQKKDSVVLVLLTTYQEKYGPSHEVAKELSEIYLTADDYAHALEQLEVIESFEPDNLNNKVKIALVSIEMKDYTRAAQNLEEVLHEMPESDKIRFYLAATYEEMTNTAKAVENYRLIPSTSTFYGDAVIHAAFLLRTTQPEEARTLVATAIDKRQDLPQLYAFYATILDEQKQYKTAVDMLSGAVERFPKHAQLRFYLGTMFDRIGQNEKCIGEMKQVLEIDENHVQALNFLAYTYAEMSRDLPTAEEMARKALNLQPSDGYILDTMGWVLYKQGRYQEAVRYLESAYQMKSSESVIAEHLGDVYYRMQLVEKARSMYRHALENEQDAKKVEEIRNKLAATESPVDSNGRGPASNP